MCNKARDGTVLTEKDRILERWSEYIGNFFYNDRGEKTLINKPLDGPHIMKDGVRNAVKSLKHGKATGLGQISIERINALEESGVDFVSKLLKDIYDSGIIPQGMRRSVFIPLPQKPGEIEQEH